MLSLLLIGAVIAPLPQMQRRTAEGGVAAVAGGAVAAVVELDGMIPI